MSRSAMRAPSAQYTISPEAVNARVVRVPEHELARACAACHLVRSSADSGLKLEKVMWADTVCPRLPTRSAITSGPAKAAPSGVSRIVATRDSVCRE